MNVSTRLFVKSRQGARAARLLAYVAGCAVLGGCVSDPFDRAKVDPRSPIAAEVAKVTSAPAVMPKFSDIPPVPTDLRPKAAYGTAAAQMETARAEVTAASAPETWTLKETDRYAASAQQAAGPEIAPADTSATEAFAAAQRKRATPPPPPKR
jgi:hypothetical protein